MRPNPVPVVESTWDRAELFLQLAAGFRVERDDDRQARVSLPVRFDR